MFSGKTLNRSSTFVFKPTNTQNDHIKLINKFRSWKKNHLKILRPYNIINRNFNHVSTIDYMVFWFGYYMILEQSENMFRDLPILPSYFKEINEHLKHATHTTFDIQTTTLNIILFSPVPPVLSGLITAYFRSNERPPVSLFLAVSAMGLLQVPLASSDILQIHPSIHHVVTTA